MEKKKKINIHEDKSTNIIGGGITISTVIAYHLLSILLIDKVEN